jgi:hypothetical protein
MDNPVIGAQTTRRRSWVSIRRFRVPRGRSILVCWRPNAPNRNSIAGQRAAPLAQSGHHEVLCGRCEG